MAVELGTALVVGLTFAVLFLAVRARGASVAWAAAVSLALAVGSEARFTPRPEVLGRLLMALLCLVLVRDLRRRSWRELALVPVLLALWANVHAGVVFGLGVVGCHLLGVLLPSLLRVQGAARRRLLLGCTGAGLVCLAALLLNPGGVDLLRYALFHVSKVGAVVKLGEFETPGLAQRPLFWIVLVALPMLLWVCRREARLSEWLGWLAFGALACRAVRLIPEFFLVVGPSLGWAAGTGLARWRAAAGRAGRWVRGAAPAAPPGPGAGDGAVSHAAPGPPRRARARPVPEPAARDRHGSPVGLSGRVFAGWDVSGMVEWSLPDAPVQVDPRLLAYPESVFHAVEQAEESQEAFDAYVDHWGVELGAAEPAAPALHRRGSVRCPAVGGGLLGRGRANPRPARRAALRRAGPLPGAPGVPSGDAGVRELEVAPRSSPRPLARRGEPPRRSLPAPGRRARGALPRARAGRRALPGRAGVPAGRGRRGCAVLASPHAGRPSLGERGTRPLVLAGELARRPGSEDPGPLLARATALAPGSPDVWTGAGRWSWNGSARRRQRPPSAGLSRSSPPIGPPPRAWAVPRR